MTDFTFLGVPIDSVGRAGGTEHGPAKLRALGLADLCEADAGDLDVRIRGEERDPVTGILGSPDVLTTTTAIRQATTAALTSGERPFLVGGCCTVLPGALAAARDVLGRTAVAYLDGHLDLSDGNTSPTGEAADMPLSVALGRGPAAWVDACGGATSRVDDVVPIGYRDPDHPPYSLLTFSLFPDSQEHLATFNVAFHSAAETLTRYFGPPTESGDHQLSFRTWPYAYQRWSLPEAEFTLVQDEFDIQDGMDVTLWAQPVGTPIEKTLHL